MAAFDDDFDHWWDTTPDAYPDVDFCSGCHDHADYWFDGEDWLSKCCDRPPVEVDPT